MQTATINNPKLTHYNVPITGMTCAGCASSVGSILEHQPGVYEVNVNYATQTASIEIDDTQTNLITLRQKIQEIGYDLILESNDPSSKQDEIKEAYYRDVKKRFWWSAALSLPVVFLGMFMMDWESGKWISLPIAAVVLFLFWPKVFYQCLETGHQRNGQYGYLGGFEYRDCFFI